MAHDVFISYSSKDKPTADAVCARLEAKGVRCWIAPRDVIPGSDWSESIIDGISGARAVVLVYSQSANESPQVRREIERAVAKGLAIIPFRIQDVPMSKSLEYFISTPHWLDAITPPLEQHLDYLAETLRRLVRPDDERRPQPVPDPVPVPPPPPPIPVPVPVPTPVPHPVPKQAWVKIAIGAAVALVLVAWMLTNFSGTSSKGFDSRFVGSWTAQAVVNNLPIQLTMTLDQNGNGTVNSSLRDRGRFNSGRGQWAMTNSMGQTLRGTYTFTSATEMSMTGPLGTATWRRDAASPPDPSGRISGKWTFLSTGPDGLPVTTTLIFAADGTYQFDATSVDTFVAQAQDGKWLATSKTTSRTTDGTYQFTGTSGFTMTSPQGLTSWTRR
jgi:hypothetical protein